jgi:hypothetical protein
MIITVEAFNEYLEVLTTAIVYLNAISNQKQTTQREIEEAENVYGKAEAFFQHATQEAVAIHRVFLCSNSNVDINKAFYCAIDSARKNAELAQLAAELAFEELHELKDYMLLLVMNEFDGAFDLEFALLAVDHFRHDPRFTDLVEKGTDEKANAVIDIARSGSVKRISKYEDIMNNSMFHINQFNKLMSIYGDSSTLSTERRYDD